MGGCVGSRHGSSGSLNENSDGAGVALGRNQPLRKERPKWKSEFPMTAGQLRSKRDEFWDTAPAFEGRKEIWDALRAAASAFEGGDHQLAQAIVDGASISLPHGSLTECYDELGNRYRLPVYCLAPPVNLVEGGGGGNSDGDSQTSDAQSAPPPPPPGQELPLRLRVSMMGRDVRLVARTTDTVLQAKRRLQALEGPEPSSQRWFYSGRLLADRTRLVDARIAKDFVVQVVVTPRADAGKDD
ncbi:ubiquitin domain-containing protein 2-like isoform X1 [Petromyzon marinus]|uniref:Ubiquitin domain-containing protein 2-like isoform X1 n=1 Tax=Petromyzon marinus TaxID=7757 RepID=A0AAJ7WSN9_PETMA|nr:ubiquitin domain-containing protein 2-like isoform X1 [Petromyzon marinus]